MAQRIKKQFFRILPVSLVSLLVVSLAIGLWVGQDVSQTVAAQAQTTALELYDTNSNGKIDRIQLSIDNPDLDTWTAGIAGSSVIQGVSSITISGVTLATAGNANPVKINIALDETDTDLQVNTDGVTTAIMEYSYTQQGLGNGGIQNAGDGAGLTAEELNVINAGDSTSVDTEIDKAAPVALSFIFRDTEPDGTVDRADITYSEAMQVTYDVGDWVFTTGTIGMWTETGATASGSDIRLTTLAINDMTGGITLPTVSYDAAAGTANSVKDLASIPNPAASFSNQNIVDGAAPIPLSAQYQDSDADGTVDRIEVLMSVDRLLSCAYEALDWTLDIPGTISLSSISGCSVSSNSIYLSVSANALITGGAVDPSFHYTNQGTLGSVKDQALNPTPSSASITITDFAGPVMASAVYLDTDVDGSVDTIRTTWSEIVSMNLSDGLDWTITIGDINATFASAPDDNDGNNDLDILVTADSNETGSATAVTITYLGANSAVIDLASLDGVVTGVPVTATDGAAPFLISFSSTTPSDTYGPGSDINITATYTENIVSGQVNVDLNNTIVGLGLTTILGNTIYDNYTVGATGSGESVTNLDVTQILSQSASDGVNTNSSTTMPLTTIITAQNIDIDVAAPTSTYEDVYSDNTFDDTFAGVGKYVIVEVTPNETLMSLSVDFTNPGFGVIPAVDDGSGCDVLGGDDIWTACAPVTSNPPDSDAVADFTIDMTDLAGNPASILSGALGSSVTVDTIAPTINQITTMTQTAASPNTYSLLWYNYTGDTFEAFVEGNENLSEVRVCIQSLTGVDPTATCDDTDFSAGVLGTDYISSGPIVASNSYTFTGGVDFEIIAGQALTPMTGYSMNILIIDSAGNPYASANPADAFVMVWNVEPSVLDPMLAPAGGLGETTLWSSIDDFTNVSGLTFKASSGVDMIGQLAFTGSINLTDPATVTALQTFATNVHVRGGDAADGTVDISVNAGAIAALNQPADLTISVPGATSQPGIVMYNDAGTECGSIANDATQNSALPINVCGDDITFIDWDNVTKLLTFSTDGFSGFGADSTAPINQDTVFASNISRTVNTAVTIVSSGNATNNVWFAPSGTTNFVAGATMTKAASGTATTISAPSVVGTYKLYVLDAVGNVSAPSTATLTTTAVSGGGGNYTPPVDNALPVATSISIAGGAAQTSSLSVTLALSATNSAQMMISNTSDFAGAVWETYATSKAWTLTANFGAKTVYAKFKNTAGSISSVISDAIDYVEVVNIIETPIGDANLITQDPAPAPALPPQVTIGSLVKRADMTSVYFIDQDNRRHAFPNSAVYLSYYPDFSGIQTISAAIMAEIPLGNNVTMRPGTYLVKIQSDPKVYAVAPYGVLKWVTSEQLAISLYGSAWATRIIDVEPTFFSNYQIGSSITTAVHPAGSAFSYQGDSKVYYVEGGKKRYITSDVFINNKFQNKFISRNISTSITYPDGVDLPSQGMEVIMTLR